MKKGIIFDMDGTLWDSAKGVAKSWSDIITKKYPERKEITEHDVKSVMGKTMDVIAMEFFPELNPDERAKLLKECGDWENEYLREHGGKLYDNLEVVLKELSQKYNLYIVSNCQSGYIEAFLEHYNFGEYFKDIECFGNNNMKKGDNIKLVVERNVLDEAVYVGDIQGDYDASKEAGIQFIHAAYGFGAIDEEVPRINELSELPEVVEQVFN